MLKCPNVSSSVAGNGFLRNGEFMAAYQTAESGCDSARFVRDARQLQAHLNAAQSSGQHQVVEAAQVSNAEDPAREFGESCTERHIKILQNDFAQAVGIVALWHENSSQGVGVFARLFAHKFQAPGPYRSAGGLAMTGMPAENIGQAFLLQHQ